MATRSKKHVRTLPQRHFLEGTATALISTGFICLVASLLAHSGWTISIFQFVLSVDGTAPVLNTGYAMFDLVILVLSAALAMTAFGLLCVAIFSPLLLAARRADMKLQADILKEKMPLHYVE